MVLTCYKCKLPKRGTNKTLFVGSEACAIAKVGFLPSCPDLLDIL